MLRRDFIASSIAGSCLLRVGMTEVTAASLLAASPAAASSPAAPTLLLHMAKHDRIANGIREALAESGQAPLLEFLLESAMLFDGHSLAELLVRYPGHRLVALTDD